jgi:hypothetical protein
MIEPHGPAESQAPFEIRAGISQQLDANIVVAHARFAPPVAIHYTFSAPTTHVGTPAARSSAIESDPGSRWLLQYPLYLFLSFAVAQPDPYAALKRSSSE